MTRYETQARDGKRWTEPVEHTTLRRARHHVRDEKRMTRILRVVRTQVMLDEVR